MCVGPAPSHPPRNESTDMTEPAQPACSPDSDQLTALQRQPEPCYILQLTRRIITAGARWLTAVKILFQYHVDYREQRKNSEIILS